MLVPCATERPQSHIGFQDLGLIEDAAVFSAHGRIVALGARAEVERKVLACEDPLLRDPAVIEALDCVVVPGFVDAHTHPLYAGNREADFAARLRGETPRLGMLHTVKETRAALGEPQTFWRVVAARLRRMLAHGTTTAEVKSGYALSAAGELALLDLIHAHADEIGLPRLVATFLGAHAVPPESRDADGYVDYLIEAVIPHAARHGARYADAFCEPGYFSVTQTERYLAAAREKGLRLRLHADEMQRSGAAELAARMGADAADHVNCVNESDIEALAAANVTVVACPATIDYLALEQRAPVRKLLEAGVDVALASDFNPGTSPCFNLQTVAYFGRREFKLSAAETLYALTRAAAKSLNDDAGQLVAGGRADMVALALGSPDEIGWQYGGNLAQIVVRAGHVAA